jgi:hypothetical protein
MPHMPHMPPSAAASRRPEAKRWAAHGPRSSAFHLPAVQSRALLQHVLAFPVLALAFACGGGGSSGGNPGGPNNPAPIDTGDLPPSAGIVSVAAGNGAVQVRWDGRDGSGSDQQVALFAATSEGAIFAGPPVATATGAGATVVSGLTNGAPQFLRLALVDGPAFAPVGATFLVTPGPPIHVDDSSTAVSPDGATPATAFPSLAAGVQAALNAGGGNVWVAEGTYVDVGLSIPSGIALFGGFAADFVLANRDAGARTTTLRGGLATAALELTGGGGVAVVDGLVIEGGSATFAIDIDSLDARLGSVTVRDAASHGLRMRDTSASGAVDIELAGSRFLECGGNGLSLEGTFDLAVYGCRFSGNSREGAALGPLRARAGITASLRVRDSIFAANGEDGLDVKLDAPLVAGGSSSYGVAIDGSRFEENGWNGGGITPTGARIDIDFDLVPGWSADIVVRGSTARDNRGDGFLFDLDSTATAYVHRVLATANAGDGLRVTSESTAGLVVVGASIFSANLGAGVRASAGNFPVIAAHCVFAGNGGGGLVSETVTSLASSSVAWLQAAPFVGTREHFVVDATDTLMPAFAAAPVAYQRGVAFFGGLMTLADASGLALGDSLEIADDGVVRTVDAFGAANQVSLQPAPTSVESPSSVTRFGVASVTENYALAVGSPASGAGMPTPAGTLDAGPFALPLGGAPGVEPALRPTLFRAASVSPAPTTALGANTAITVTFDGGTLDGGSISNEVRARDGLGNLLVIGAALSGTDLAVSAPVGGWPSGEVTLELHAGLASTAGDDLVAPIAIPFIRP